MAAPARLSGAAIALVLALAGRGASAGPCPKVVVTVDNDVPGSGYSEERPENWASNTTGACSKTYRYLSKYTPKGDKSAKGKAIWKPAIPAAGHYEVVVSYRATPNRTDDADYFVDDDLGKTTKKVLNQRLGSNCTHTSLGTFWCVPGGACRVVLDGTDDSKSDSADVTTFTRVDCDEDAGPAPGRCDGIRAHAKWEVCAETDTTCAGTFDDGSGCVAYCAAAGMTCVARYGGSAGCSKEADGGTIPCDANDKHQSDWCECQGPPPQPDAGAGGAPASQGGAGGATVAQGGAGGDGELTGPGGAGGAGGAGGSAIAGGAGGAITTSDPGDGASAGGASAGSEGHGVDEGSGSSGGCGCASVGGPARSALGLVAALAAAAIVARRRERR
jgi:MYXO-CTERM domain-containing protein